MKKKFAAGVIIAMTIAICISACGNDKKVKTVKKVKAVQTENESEVNDKINTESKVEDVNKSFGAYDMTKRILPKVYIDCSDEPSKEQYCDASVKIIDESGQYENNEQNSAKIKIRGNSTANAHKKPYNIKFSDKQNILGMGKSKKWCLLANAFDPTMLRNALALELARKTRLQYTPASTFVELYCNGEYKGVYYMTNPVNTGKDKVDIDVKKNDYLIELETRLDDNENIIMTPVLNLRFEVEEGNMADLTYLNDFLEKFEKSISGGYKEVTKYIDWDSFVDYYVIGELLKDVDFSTSSTYFYIKDNKMYAGPVWDYDLSMGNASEIYPYYVNSDTTKDSTTEFYCNKFWYFYINQIPEFQRDVKARFAALQPVFENMTTDNELGPNRIDAYCSVYKDAFARNYTVWNVADANSGGEKTPLPSYEENVEFLRQWIQKRNEWLKEQWLVE